MLRGMEGRRILRAAWRVIGLAGLGALAIAGQASAVTVGAGHFRATITRDAYGVPHISSRTRSGMWFGAGYAQAQDRLVQLELIRRNSEGTLAQVFGPSELSTDEDNRQQFYTLGEMQVQLRSTPRWVQRILRDYAAGVNAYIAAAYRTPASENARVPYEFWLAGQILGLKGPYRPSPWRAVDTIAIGDVLAREFGGGGGNELNNLTLLQYLQHKYPSSARSIFNDLRWINDPTAPTTVPSGAANRPTPPNPVKAQRALGFVTPGAARAGAAALNAMLDRRQATGNSLHVPYKDGSNAFVVSPRRTASHRALLWGAPQEGFGSPSIDVEEYLHGPSYDAGGMTIPGVPVILIGQNRDIAFTTTSEELVDQQIYAEKTDFSTPVPRYRFKGKWRRMTVIHESIPVAGQKPVPYVIYRTVHGPVFQVDPGAHVAFSMRFASWKREQGTVVGFAEQGQDHNLAQYRRSISKIVTLHNFFYADRRGNIAYFGAGLVPILPKCAACDPRLPHRGDGSQEWRGFIPFSRMPHSINPRQGYLVNWNTKPDRRHYYQQNGGDEYWGTIYRSDRIAQILKAHPRLTFAQALSVERDIGTIDGDRTYRPTAPYFLPFLFRAYARLTQAHDPLVSAGTHPDLAGAIAQLKSWNRHSSLGVPAMSIYVEWVGALQRNLFGGGLNPGEQFTGAVNLSDTSVGDGDLRGNATYNLTEHILARTHGLVPCGTLCFAHDYFGGHRDQLLIESLNDAIAILSGTGKQLDNGDANGFGTTDIAKWGWKPYPDINWDELDPVAIGVTTHFGRSPSQERSTYMQMMELSTPIRGINVLPPGQSGFINKNRQPSPHFGDQIKLFDSFSYKPMRLR
jgi:penicillin G amidase